MQSQASNHQIAIAAALAAVFTALFTFYLTSSTTALIIHEMGAMVRQATIAAKEADKCSAGYASDDDSCPAEIEIDLPDPNSPKAI